MDTLILIALKQEAPALSEQFNCYVTGMGKINAAATAAMLIERYTPKRVINFGTAGGITVDSGIHRCTTFTQRDYRNPFDTPPAITHGSRRDGLVLSTGDDFVEDTTNIDADLVDMEAYAIAKVCEDTNTPFFCWKYITDEANTSSEEAFSAHVADGEPHYVKILADMFDKETRDAVIEQCAQRLEREFPGPGAGPAASILRDMKSNNLKKIALDDLFTPVS
jgi:adenosylhomocysteine nucleosidase